MLTPFLQLCYNYLTKKVEKFDEFLILCNANTKYVSLNALIHNVTQFTKKLKKLMSPPPPPPEKSKN